MLSPKRTKYRKIQKGRIKGVASRSTKINFGSFALKATEAGRLTARQIEASRRTITRKIKKIGKLWIRVFPDIPVTSKGGEARMGKGKGSVDYWMFRVKPNRIIFEIDGVTEEMAKKVLKGAGAKLPMNTKFIMTN